MSNFKIPTAKELLDKERQRRCYSTGCLGLDLAIGKFDPITGEPGIPERTICEFFGYNSTLKTGTMEQLALSIQKADPKNICVFLFSEEPNFERMQALGLDLDRIIPWTFTSSDAGESMSLAEEGLDLAVQLVLKNPHIKLVALDSIKAMVTETQILDKGKKINEIWDSAPAIKARMMENFLARFIPANKSNAILFLINQISQSIGNSYITGEDIKPITCGGRAKEHMAYLRVACASTKWEEDEVHPLWDIKQTQGLNIFYKIIKNKFAKRYGSQKINTKFSFGEKRFLREWEVLNYADYLGLVKRNGKVWWEIGETKFQGREAVEQFLRDNQDERIKLEKEIIKHSEDLFEASGKRKAKDLLDES